MNNNLFKFVKEKKTVKTYAIHQSQMKLFWKRFFSKKLNIAIFTFFILVILAMLIMLAFIKNPANQSLNEQSIYVNNLPPYFNQVIERNFERGQELNFIREIANKELTRSFEANEQPVFRILYDSAFDLGGSLTTNTDIVILRYNPYDLIKAINLNNASDKINVLHMPFLGTNNNGIDIYSRLNISIFITILTIILAIAFNVFIGFSLAALYVFNKNKWYGILVDKIATILTSIPEIIWILLLCIFFGTNWYEILISFILISWTSYYEISKNEISILSKNEFILASKSIGLNNIQITYRKLFKLILPSILILVTDRLAINILIVSSLAFLDLINNSNNINIGNILKEALQSAKNNPWYLIFTTMYIAMFCLSFKLFNVVLSQTYNPKNG